MIHCIKKNLKRKGCSFLQPLMFYSDRLLLCFAVGFAKGAEPVIAACFALLDYSHDEIHLHRGGGFL